MNREILIWLSTIRGMGPKSLYRILLSYAHLEEVFSNKEKLHKCQIHQ